MTALQEWIGSAPAGAQLPSTRRLVEQHAASPVTVQRALRTLGSQGLVESRPGVGTFVRARRAVRVPDHGWQTAAIGSPRSAMPAVAAALRTAPPGARELHSGYPEPDLLPVRLVRGALARAARSAAAVSRPPSAGHPELRAWFATELAESARADVAAPGSDDVVIVPGSQSGLTSVFRALVPPGRPLLIESPTYWGAILAAHQVGARLAPVRSDMTGPDPAELDRVFRETGARALYVQPNYANPTGAQWSTERAEEILEVVRSHDAFLIEDDWAHEFGIDSDPHPVAGHDESGHVVYLRSLTKSVSPSVRVGAVVARGPVRERLLADRTAESMYVSDLLQQAALEIVSDPGWRTHLRRLRPALRARRDLLAQALRDHAPEVHVADVPAGGLHLWARLPQGADVAGVVRRCESEGVYVAPGDEWFPAEPSGPFLRLNFTGPGPAGFAEAARTIAASLAAGS